MMHRKTCKIEILVNGNMFLLDFPFDLFGYRTWSCVDRHLYVFNSFVEPLSYGGGSCASVTGGFLSFDNSPEQSRLMAINLDQGEESGKLPSVFKTDFIESTCPVDNRIYLITAKRGELFYFEVQKLMYVKTGFTVPMWNKTVIPEVRRGISRLVTLIFSNETELVILHFDKIYHVSYNGELLRAQTLSGFKNLDLDRAIKTGL
jgi:hypothetical protein